MDPDACMSEAMEAYRDEDYETVRDRLSDYSDWLRKDGFCGEEAPDIAQALYWLSVWNHTGQHSYLYSALSVNPFRPGPISNGPESGSYAEMLVSEFNGEG